MPKWAWFLQKQCATEESACVWGGGGGKWHDLTPLDDAGERPQNDQKIEKQTITKLKITSELQTK